MDLHNLGIHTFVILLLDFPFSKGLYLELTYYFHLSQTCIEEYCDYPNRRLFGNNNGE